MTTPTRSTRRRSWRSAGILGTTLAAVAAVLSGCIAYDFGYTGASGDRWGSDMAVDLGNGTWSIIGAPAPIPVGSAPTTVPGQPWNRAFDVPVPGNYDGDAFDEPAVVRLVNGAWDPTGSWTTNGTLGTIVHPAPPSTPSAGFQLHDVMPVPADYDGDGKTDPAWYRYSDATWWILGQPAVTFGVPATPGDHWGYDQPVPADYDGDGDDDIAVFRITDGSWHSLEDGLLPSGGGGSFPIPGDYDLVGHAQPATVLFGQDSSSPTRQPATFHLPSGTTTLLHPAGAQLTRPVVGDFDNDGRSDIAVADVTGKWAVRTSTSGATTQYAGAAGEPVNVPQVHIEHIVRLTFAWLCFHEGRSCQ